MIAPESASADATTLELREPVPDEVDAGARFSIVFRVKAPATRDLHGAPFRLIDGDRVLLEGRLEGLYAGPEDAPDTAHIEATAPHEVGAFQWTLVVPAREVDGGHHAEASLFISFATRPHATSLAAWDHPSPVVAGQPFTVNVGAKCTSGCVLTGKAVEIRDPEGAVLASGILGDAPWPGTTALYWTAVEVQAPATHGACSMALAFSAAELLLPHVGASVTFSAVVIPPPDHYLTITVSDQATQAPLEHAYVRIGVHRASTDATGLARVAVSAGTHGLSIWKAGYDAPDMTVVVTGDDAVHVAMTALPEVDPFARWNR